MALIDAPATECNIFDMQRFANWVRYSITALLAATYWYSAAWFCFAATGSDPIDAITASVPTGQRLATFAILLVFVVGFAVISGGSWRRRSDRQIDDG